MAHYDRLVSTNDEALARAKAGDPGCLWIVADEQTGGRGRQGRVWSSPLGNLYASLLLIDPAPVEKAPELGFVAGVALARTLRENLGQDPRLAIKWPNDILHAGAKLSGMLLEGAHLPGGQFACVIGIGVNCCSHPENTLYPATDLAAIGSLLTTPEAIFQGLSVEMTHWLGIFAQGTGFATMRAEWLKLAGGVGSEIRVMRPSGPVEGRFRTIDSTGRLLLESPDGEVMIDAGDVFLLPAANAPSTALRT